MGAERIARLEKLLNRKLSVEENELQIFDEDALWDVLRPD